MIAEIGLAMPSFAGVTSKTEKTPFTHPHHQQYLQGSKGGRRCTERRADMSRLLRVLPRNALENAMTVEN